MNDMIRLAEIKDATDLLRIHTRSVMELCAQDYSPEQLHAWAAGTLERRQKAIQTVPYAAVYENDGVIAGYIFVKADYSIWQLYIDPDHSRKGIGSELLISALSFLKSKNIESVKLQSSLTAVPFYQKHGFVVYRHEDIKMHGTVLPIRAMVRAVRKKDRLENSEVETLVS